jgi:hypothetical protein
MYDEDVNGFFRAMGCDTDERTDIQLIFMYNLKIHVNKEIQSFRKKEQEKERYKKNNGEYFDFQYTEDDEDEGPLLE